MDTKIDLSNTRKGKKDQLLKVNRQYKYVDTPNVFQSDIMQYSVDDKFYYIIIFYEMARKRIFTKRIQNKGQQEICDAYKEFQQYMSQFQDQQIIKIITDEGKEFANKNFKTLLDENQVKLVLIDASLIDKNKSLAHINVKCRDLRTFLRQELKEFSLELLDNTLIKYNKFHNFEHIIQEFKTTPSKITLEMVQKRNKYKMLFNSAIKDKFSVRIGDIVRIQNYKHKDDNKARLKFSQGNYKIINKVNGHYVVSPMNYNKKSYINNMKKHYEVEKEWEKIYSTPCYFRKDYALKKCKQNDINSNYYPEEVEYTYYYQIHEIEKCFLTKDGNYRANDQEITDPDQINQNYDKILYSIFINPDDKPVFAKHDKSEMSVAEKQFWYGIDNNIIPVISINKI